MDQYHSTPHPPGVGGGGRGGGGGGAVKEITVGECHPLSKKKKKKKKKKGGVGGGEEKSVHFWRVCAAFVVGFNANKPKASVKPRTVQTFCGDALP